MTKDTLADTTEPQLGPLSIVTCSVAVYVAPTVSVFAGIASSRFASVMVLSSAALSPTPESVHKNEKVPLCAESTP